jgi:hypothetical protein
MTNLVRTNPDWQVFAGGPKDGNEFFGAFESPAHNSMHSRFIGGLMANPFEAAEDPIYWSFHAFIDRIWERWRLIHDVEPTCTKCTLRGFDGAPTTEDVSRTEALGYFYQFAPSEIAKVSDLDEAGFFKNLRTLREDAPARTGSVRVLRQRLDGAYEIPVLEPSLRRVALWLVHVRPPTEVSYRVSAYLHPASVPARPTDPIFKRDFYIGDYSFWKAHHLAEGQTAGAVLVATAAFNRLATNRVPLVLTLVAEEVGERSTGGGHDHGHPPGHDTGLQFDSVVLQVDGFGAPNISMGRPRVG